MCDADIHSSDIIVNEGEDVVFGVHLHGVEDDSILTLSLADGTALDGDYNEEIYQYSIDGGQTWNDIPVNGEIPVDSTISGIIVKTDTVDDILADSDETFTLTATLSTGQSSTGTAIIIDDDLSLPEVSIAVTGATAYESGESIIIETSNSHDIFDCDMYIKVDASFATQYDCNVGDIIKIKIDDFPDGHQSIDAAGFMATNFAGCDLVAYYANTENTFDVDRIHSDTVIIDSNYTMDSLPIFSSNFEHGFNFNFNSSYNRSFNGSFNFNDCSSDLEVNTTANTDILIYEVSINEVQDTDTIVTFGVSGTATEGDDYNTFTHSVTILAGQTSAIIEIDPKLDVTIEDPETVVLTLNESSNGSYTLGTIEATATINDNTPNESVTNSAVFLDSIVEGLEYTTSSGLSGITSADGSFDYSDGDTITFSIGNVTIGSIDMNCITDNQVFLQDLAGVDRTNVNDNYVENMAVLLQSIDVNSDAYDGIVITQEMRDAFSNGNGFNLAEISEEELSTIIETTGRVAISENNAMVHVQDTLEEHTNITNFEDRVADISDDESVENLMTSAQVNEDNTVVHVEDTLCETQIDNTNDDEFSENQTTSTQLNEDDPIDSCLIPNHNVDFELIDQIQDNGEESDVSNISLNEVIKADDQDNDSNIIDNYSNEIISSSNNEISSANTDERDNNSGEMDSSSTYTECVYGNNDTSDSLMPKVEEQIESGL
jgi:hypothetical protein